MEANNSAPEPPSTTTHPYAVVVPLTLGNDVELGWSEDNVYFPFSDNCVLKIVREYTRPREQANFLKRITVHLEAFSCASEAEQAGKKLVMSLLWLAISKRVTIAFDRRTGKFPFEIRNRNQSRGPRLDVEIRSYNPVQQKEFSSIAKQAYELGINVTQALLNSMEFYASSRMETTPIARFIALMTDLEAISEQCDYGDEIGTVLLDLAKQLEGNNELWKGDRELIKPSLVSQIKNLRRESVRQAIKRTLKQYNINEPETINYIEESYAIRSKILHDGLREEELYERIQKIEAVMREIYSSILKLPLLN